MLEAHNPRNVPGRADGRTDIYGSPSKRVRTTSWPSPLREAPAYDCAAGATLPG